jgi:hypothetical protein
MSEVKVLIQTDPKTELLGESNAKRLIDEVCVPEVASFEKMFREKAEGPLLRNEREVLTAYLFHKLNGSF